MLWLLTVVLCFPFKYIYLNKKKKSWAKTMKHMDIAKIMMTIHKWLRMSNQHSPNISVLSWLRAVNEWSKWHFPELKALIQQLFREAKFTVVVQCPPLCDPTDCSMPGWNTDWNTGWNTDSGATPPPGVSKANWKACSCRRPSLGSWSPDVNTDAPGGDSAHGAQGAAVRKAESPSWPKALRSSAFLLFSDKVNLTTA